MTRLSNAPSDSTTLGKAYVWLHAFAIGQYPAWAWEGQREDVITEDEQGSILVEILRREYDKLGQLISDNAECVVQPRPADALSPPDAVESLTHRMNQLRMLADYVVLAAHSQPEARESIACAAWLGLEHGVAVPLTVVQLNAPYTHMGRRYWHASQKGVAARRKQLMEQREALEAAHKTIRARFAEEGLKHPTFTRTRIANRLAPSLGYSAKYIRDLCADLK